MFGIPLPWLIVGILVSLFGTYRGGYHFGWSDRDKEMQVAIAKKNEESRKTEQKLTEQLNQQDSKLKEANDAITQKQSDLERAISSGRVRLNAQSCVQAATSAASATRDSQEAGSKSNGQANPSIDEQERATLAAIAEIIAQGDRNTAQLNACIDAYQKIRETINGSNR